MSKKSTRRIHGIALFAFCVLASALCCQAEDDFSLLPFVNRSNFDRGKTPTFTIRVEGDAKEAAELWNSVTRHLRQTEYLSGVAIFRDYPTADWNDVVATLESTPSVPRGAFICNFQHDYLEGKFRTEFFAWNREKLSGLTDAVQSKVITRNFLETRRFATSGDLMPFLLLVTTPDYQLRRGEENQLRVSLPSKSKNVWPGLVDFRLFGMCSFPQLIYPTNLEQWINIIRHAKLVSHERLENDIVCLRYLAEGGPIIREVRIDTSIARVVEYIEYPVASSEDPFSIDCYAVRTFHNRIVYDSNGRIKSFAMGTPAMVLSGVFTELKSELPDDDNLFGMEGMRNDLTVLSVDKSMLDYLEVLALLGINHGK